MARPAALDPIDRALVGALQRDGRASNKELAAKVGLAPSSALARVRALRERRVIRGVHADIDPAALGIGLQAMIAVRLAQHGRASFEAFAAHVIALPEVVAVFHVAGADDFLIHVAVRDADHLRDVTWVGLTHRPEVAHVQTSLIFEARRSTVYPDYGGVAVEGAPASAPVGRGARVRSRRGGRRRAGG